MAILIDTSVLIELERSRSAGSFGADMGDEPRAISVITASELLHGVKRGTGGRARRRQAFVEHVLQSIEAVPITEPVARVHAEVWADLSGRGQTVGAHDLWIAATALAHGMAVASLNHRDFSRIPGLRMVELPESG